jgi:8-oxo-dGTP diphosphatase
MSSSLVAQIVLTVDVAVLRLGQSGPELLLIQRGKQPYQGQWALPGGKVNAGDPTLEYAAHREVYEETGLSLASLYQLGTFGDMGRDPRGRYVSVLYAGSVEPHALVSAGDDAACAAWFPITSLPLPLAFDHDQLVHQVLARVAC